MKEKAGMPINQEEITHYLKDIRKIKVMTPDRERNNHAEVSKVHYPHRPYNKKR